MAGEEAQMYVVCFPPPKQGKSIDELLSMSKRAREVLEQILHIISMHAYAVYSYINGTEEKYFSRDFYLPFLSDWGAASKKIIYFIPEDEKRKTIPEIVQEIVPEEIPYTLFYPKSSEIEIPAQEFVGLKRGKLLVPATRDKINGLFTKKTYYVAPRVLYLIGVDNYTYPNLFEVFLAAGKYFDVVGIDARDLLDPEGYANFRSWVLGMPEEGEVEDNEQQVVVHTLVKASGQGIPELYSKLIGSTTSKQNRAVKRIQEEIIEANFGMPQLYYDAEEIEAPKVFAYHAELLAKMGREGRKSYTSII